jgi:hypothetical protein
VGQTENPLSIKSNDFLIFQMTPNLKIQNLAILISKTIETSHEARLEHAEQLSPLVELQIPIGSHVIKFGTNVNLNLL